MKRTYPVIVSLHGFIFTFGAQEENAKKVPGPSRIVKNITILEQLQ